MIRSNTVLTILLAFIIGIIPSIWIVQNDPNIKNFVMDKLIEKLERGWRAKIDFDEFHLNLFKGSIYLKNGRIQFLCNKTCWWKFEYARVSLSEILSLINRKICLNFIFDDLQIFVSGRYTNSLKEIQKHLTEMFLSMDSEDLDINLNSLRINDLKLKLIDDKRYIGFDFPGRFFGRKIKMSKNNDNNWIFSVNLCNGRFLIGDNCFVDRINSFFTFFYSAESGLFNFEFKLDSKFLFDNSSTIFAEGNFKRNKLDVNVKSDSGLFRYRINCDLDFNKKNIGKVKLIDFCVNDVFFGDLTLDLFLYSRRLRANLNFANSNLFHLSGIAECDLEKLSTAFFVENVEPIYIPGSRELLINRGKFKLKSNITNNFCLSSKYFLQVDKMNNANLLKTNGEVNFVNSIISLKGDAINSSYYLEAKFLERLYLTKFTYSKNSVNYVDLKFDNNDMTLCGSVKNYILRFFLPYEYKHLFLIDKKYFNVKLVQDSFNSIRGRLSFDDGPFYLPESYNLIENFNSEFVFDLLNRRLTFNNLKISFYKGVILSPYVDIRFSDNFDLLSVYAPIKIDNLLINWRKAFLGIVYGNLLFYKNFDEHLKINADLVLKKSVLRENPLSMPMHSSFSTLNRVGTGDFEFDLDLKLSNEGRILIDTDFLNIKSNIDIDLKLSHLKNESIFPKILGYIDIESGEFQFLKNRLHINKGQIQFMPNRPDDPLINISAKNKIKKYFISMNVSGSLKNHKISLDSTPELAEEQILALLMSGSEYASFKTDLPAILMQNLNDWVVTNKNIRSNAKNFFKKITFPFKYVQITPDFTDQSGRGGIRGTVSIDINKQLHAQIQKNFNLQEDFAFQVEYFLTDDFNIKALKDQRGEMGSELELRFKF